MRLVVMRIVPLLAFTMLAFGPGVLAQTPTHPGAGSICVALDDATSGQQASASLDDRHLRARARSGALSDRTSTAEAAYRFRPSMAFPATLQFGVSFSGTLRGTGGLPANFSRVRITSEFRNAETNELVAPPQTLHQQTETGGSGGVTLTVVASNPFEPTIATFQHDLEADVEYTVSVRLTAFASGANAEADFLNGNRGVQFSCLGITPDWDDTDGDGLYDIWETVGIDIDGDGTIDFGPADLGTDYAGRPITLDPNRKDILVEMDYFDCNVAGSDCDPGDTHSHDPTTSTVSGNPLDIVVAAFDAAPVSNPSGAPDGIALWLQLDEALPHREFCELDETCIHAMKADTFGTEADRADARRLAAKALMFRYAVWVHQRAPTTTSSGRAEGTAGESGNDFIVSLGAFSRGVGSLEQQAGTLMHELGHTLGLGHGGTDRVNCKPNHLSVMSYVYQMRGVQPGGVFDYSRMMLPGSGVLREDDLDETIGVEDGAFDIFYGPPTLSGDTGSARIGAGMGPIDWDLDTIATNTSAQADINFFGITGCGGLGGTPNPAPEQELFGATDWDNLLFSFRDSPYFEEGVVAPELDPELDRQSADIIDGLTWRAQNPMYYEYAVKFVCGSQDAGEAGIAARFAPGQFATVVNIRNPNRDRVRFRKRLSVALPPDEQRPGDVLVISTDSLGHEEALKVDCPDVEANVFGGSLPAEVIDGFLVVQSPVELDVSTVYTLAGIDGGSSVDVETAAPREVDVRLPNLTPSPAFPTPAQAGLPAGLPGVLFCVPNPAGGASARIRALIRNTGPVPAGPSRVRVDFGSNGSAGSGFADIGELVAGAGQAAEFGIPGGCYQVGTCTFRIMADALARVAESNEADNVAEGFCTSPAG